MLKACTNLCDAYTIKRSNFERGVSLRAFIRVKSTLAMMIITTADNVSIRCEIQDMRASTADLDNFLIKHIECINSQRQVSFLESIVSKLSLLVSAPRINLSPWLWLIIV